jgi:D-aminopeptidase
MGWNCAVSKHPKRAINEIYEAIQKAVPKRKEIEPFTFKSPLEMEVRYKRLESAQSASRGFNGAERIDPYTVRRTLQSIQDYY